ncbi:MAG TPA: tRNA (N6-threonylcarbamoyladenosine(37)-N6)-methyltransferase TrmO [Gammaproteobacteria bacterium]|nr:tRNA (N6-threonylcarbamoyladenosine(37)-N6)-methyltransferase TrmO [Gammaproteobacteria bacterium]
MRTAFQFAPVGVIHSCFREKFGIPRQPGLVPGLTARLQIHPPYDREEAFRGLEAFSHVWILFVFHANLQQPWRPMVRPPRLGGNRQVGVFASRSPFRPNPLGLSVVALKGLERQGGRLELILGGGDFLDGTPVLDVKPYLPYADCPTQAHGGWADAMPPATCEVSFTESAREACRDHGRRLGEDLEVLVRTLVSQDPRPAYKSNESNKQRFAMKLFDLDVEWIVENGHARILSLHPLSKDVP